MKKRETVLRVGKYLIVAFFVCISFSCNRFNLFESSNSFLSKEQVEDILLEIYLIEAKAKVMIFSEPAEKVRIQVNRDMQHLFEHNNITYKQFIDSYSHYMKDVATSKKMMTNITNRLIVLEAKHTGNIKLIDSLTVK